MENVKLVLNTTLFSVEGHMPNTSLDLKQEDYENKTIKEVISKYIFFDILKGQEEEIAQQAIQIVFNFIQPKNISDSESWWNQPFETLIEDSNEIILDLEFSPEGLAFMEQMM